jgi:hypothetical protein
MKKNENFNKNKKEKSTNILVNKKKFGPEGYFSSLTKKFFFQYSLVPEEQIFCDIKINNSIKCFFTTLKTYQKNELGQKYLDEIKGKISNDNEIENNDKIYLLLYFDVKDEYLNFGFKEITDNLKYMNPNDNFDFSELNENQKEDEIDIKFKKNEKDLMDINEFCILNNIKLILSTNFDECIQCIYQLTTLKLNIKSLESKKDNKINNDTIIELLCKIEGINKNDAVILINHYKTIKNLCIATENNDLCSELNILPLEFFPEIDEKKKKAIHDVFHLPFKKNK